MDGGLGGGAGPGRGAGRGGTVHWHHYNSSQLGLIKAHPMRLHVMSWNHNSLHNAQVRMRCHDVTNVLCESPMSYGVIEWAE